MLRVEEVKTVEGFERLSSAWNNLLENSENKNIFLTFEWLYTWWEYYGYDKKLLILLAIDGDKIIGIAPLMTETRRMLRYFPIKTISFIGTGLSDYADFIIVSDREKVIELFIEYLLKKRSMWNEIILREIREDSQNLIFIQRGFEKKGCISNSRIIGKCSHIKITTDWQEYYSSLSGNWKRDIRKKHHRLEKCGLSYNFTSEEKGADSAFVTSLLDMHFNGMAIKKKESVLGTERGSEFVKAIVDRLKKNGWVAIDTMRINDKIAAYALGFRYENKYYHWNMARNHEFDKFSPGNLLFCHMLEDAFMNNSVEEFDTLRGEESWKFRWPKSERNNYQIDITGNSPYINILLKAHNIFGSARRFFKARTAEIFHRRCS